MNWENAIQYCEDLNLAGYSDWRLPNRKELRTLVDYTRYNPSIDTNYFNDTYSSSYWSGTTSATGTDCAWCIYFDYGSDYGLYKSYSRYVRAVRAGHLITGPFDPLIIYVQATPSSGYAPHTAYLSAHVSSGEPPYTFSWDFGDESPESTLQNPSHTYAAPGTYTAVCTVTDNEDQTASDSVVITVGETSGELMVTLEPSQARTDGARWRVNGGGWHNSGETLELVPGDYTLECKAIEGWIEPNNQIVTITRDELRQVTATYTETSPPTATLTGFVSGKTSGGVIEGALAGADVVLDGGPGVYRAALTGIDGTYAFLDVPAGEYTMTISKDGYYPESTTLTVQVPMTTSQFFTLTKRETSVDPGVFDFKSPNGEAFLPNMPGDLSFDVMVDWQGGAGSVRFMANGVWYDAETSDLGGGVAMAELTIASPLIIDACTELTIEVINAEGKKRYFNMGVHFIPLVGLIPWYEDNIFWSPSGIKFAFKMDYKWEFDFPLETDGFDLKWALGYEMALEYDAMSASLDGSLEGFGELSFDTPTQIKDVKITCGASIAIGGDISISMAGCDPPVITPSWSISLGGETGVEAPMVLLLDTIAAGAGTALANVPGIKKPVFQLKYEPGGSISGEYPNGQTGDCLFGAVTTSGDLSAGLKAVAKAEFSKKIKGGVYIGGYGKFNLDICPDLEFTSFTGSFFAGAWAKFYLFETGVEFASEIEWDFTGGDDSLSGSWDSESGDITYLNNTSPNPRWQPIGKSNLKWGSQNRIASYQKNHAEDYRSRKSTELETTGTSEESLIENVTWVANPSIVCSGTVSRILYALFDDQKPWHQISDLGEVIQTDLDPWVTGRMTDDDAAEFSPEAAEVDNNTLVAAWSRVDGDVSGAEAPEDLAPYLEIVASFYDKETLSWSSPVQVTTNAQTDRDPIPVTFGEHTGLLWIQNQGEAMVGNATLGDSLLYAEWNGTSWDAPVVVWTGQKGIVSFSSATDANGECHVVMCVDEDGDDETDSDLELYLAATSGGVWQAAARMTNDTVVDKIPVLVAPEGVPILVWSADLTLTYTPLSSWNPKVVYSEETLTGKAPSLDGIGFPGGAAIAYSAQHPDGADLFALLRRGPGHLVSSPQADPG